MAMQNFCNQGTGPNPYELPAGKEYHIFIACCGLDSREGKWLMEQLESRYPFRCVYHERDFRPGAMIVDNMREYMDKSVKVLLLLSNGFFQSYYCKLEETFAISLSDEAGQNCIIPVLLEDVPLPPVLRHMTYIDARLPGDVVAQIREAYCRTAHQIGLSPSLCHIGGDDNGKRIGIVEGHHSSLCVCGCRWKFEDFNLNYTHFDEDTKQHIEEMCFDATETLNSKPGMRFYGYFTQRREFIGVFLACLIYSALVVGIYLTYIQATNRSFDGTDVYVPIIVGVSMLPTVYFLVAGYIGSKLTRKYIETTLWKIVKQHYKKSKCLMFYDNVPVGDSPEYVLLYLRNKFSGFAENHEAFEEWADKLIECTIAYYSHDIIHWEDLPKSSYNRHDTWKQRECICQLVEPHLSELSLGQCVWFKYLGKREHKTFSNGTVTYGRTIIL